MKTLPYVAFRGITAAPERDDFAAPPPDESASWAGRAAHRSAPRASRRALESAAQRAALETSAGRNVLLGLLTGEYACSGEHLAGAAALRADAGLRDVALALLAEGPGPVDYHRLRSRLPSLAPEYSLWSALGRLRVLHMIWTARAVFDLRPMAFGLNELGAGIATEVLFRPLLAELVTTPS